MLHKALFAFLFILSSSAYAQETFLIVDATSMETLTSTGNVNQRISPCSTAKLFISLIGYAEGILESQDNPVFEYNARNTKDWQETRDICKQDQSPKSWMQNSCVWCSQVITRQIGLPKFKESLAKLQYGNQDVSQENGLTHAWLSSTLEISPLEQIAFLHKLYSEQLPVKKEAIANTKALLNLGELAPGWQLFGKTGSGSASSITDPETQSPYKHGWLIGWIKNQEKCYLFAYLLEDEKPEVTAAGLRAKEAAVAKLRDFIKSK